jgi:hypothetical protein
MRMRKFESPDTTDLNPQFQTHNGASFVRARTRNNIDKSEWRIAALWDRAKLLVIGQPSVTPARSLYEALPR